jgi:hypothetical protein
VKKPKGKKVFVVHWFIIFCQLFILIRFSGFGFGIGISFGFGFSFGFSFDFDFGFGFGFGLVLVSFWIRFRS